jgi:hypothetical protein
MDDATPLAKAYLCELDAKSKNIINQDKQVTVQFNPETLKVSFANQLVPTPGQDQQFVGAGTTKLSAQIWFDVNAPGVGQENDVRTLTGKVAYFITPREVGKSAETKAIQYVPPVVRFVWGSFQFDGIMDSLEESLEYFSSEGRPLRASLTISISQQKIQVSPPTQAASQPPGAAGPAGGGPAGTSPLIQASAGATLQGLAASAGASWQAIASANGIENPRQLQPGQLIDLSVQVSTPFGQ